MTVRLQSEITLFLLVRQNGELEIQRGLVRMVTWEHAPGPSISLRRRSMLALAARVVATETPWYWTQSRRSLAVPRCNSPSIIEALHRDDRIGSAECEGITNGDPDRTIGVFAGLLDIVGGIVIRLIGSREVLEHIEQAVEPDR